MNTARTTLRPFADGDVHELLAIFRDPDVRRFLLDDSIVPAEWVRDEIAGSQARFATSGAGLWSIRLLDRPDIIGFAGFREFFEPAELQLIYGLLPPYWGRGLATEVAAGVRDHAFADLGFSEVLAAIDIPNESSGAVLERIGMKRTHTTDEGAGGTAFYALTRAEWASRALPDSGAL